MGVRSQFRIEWHPSFKGAGAVEPDANGGVGVEKIEGAAGICVSKDWGPGFQVGRGFQAIVLAGVSGNGQVQRAASLARDAGHG